jgi:hypothetical protein
LQSRRHGDTREGAQRECLDAIAFALEGNPTEYDGITEATALKGTVASTDDQLRKAELMCHRQYRVPAPGIGVHSRVRLSWVVAVR